MIKDYIYICICNFLIYDFELIKWEILIKRMIEYSIEYKDRIILGYFMFFFLRFEFFLIFDEFFFY